MYVISCIEISTFLKTIFIINVFDYAFDALMLMEQYMLEVLAIINEAVDVTASLVGSWILDGWHYTGCIF